MEYLTRVINLGLNICLFFRVLSKFCSTTFFASFLLWCDWSRNWKLSLWNNFPFIFLKSNIMSWNLSFRNERFFNFILHWQFGKILRPIYLLRLLVIFESKLLLKGMSKTCLYSFSFGSGDANKVIQKYVFWNTKVLYIFNISYFIFFLRYLFSIWSW